MEKKFDSFCSEDTYDIGRRIGGTLSRGDIIAIYGGLGAGKTVFVKGVAKGLGVEGCITSPTFAIVNEYRNDVEFYHFDFYRINDETEAYDIGFYEYLNGEGICAIEWADRIIGLLPVPRIDVRIERAMDKGTDRRAIYISKVDKK